MRSLEPWNLGAKRGKLLWWEWEPENASRQWLQEGGEPGRCASCVCMRERYLSACIRVVLCYVALHCMILHCVILYDIV